MAKLLAEVEPPPVEIHNPNGASDFLVLCEHAGRLIPASLGNLGLPATELSRHIAWDIGARDISVALANKLDATLIMQRYSRLVCDCNRRVDVPSFIPEKSENTSVPGNIGLSEHDRRARIEEIYLPFHDCVSREIDARDSAGRRTMLVTIHSFTPSYDGVSRPWEIGVLYNRDRTLSPAMLSLLTHETAHVVGDNQPYSVGDDTDYAIPVHGEARNLPCVEIEIRNDLTGERQTNYWASLLADMLRKAADSL